MKYTYNQRSLFDTPEKYMYTGYQGVELIESYFEDRQDILKSCLSNVCSRSSTSGLVHRSYEKICCVLLHESSEALSVFRSYVPKISSVDSECQLDSEVDLELVYRSIDKPTLSHPIETSTLLKGLVVSLLSGPTLIDKALLDRLVKKFEVTKKLYDEYAPGFGKGRGNSRSIKLYWLFGLALSLYYLETREIKYLNTLLKITDLITSLPVRDLARDIPECGLNIVLSLEVVYVQILLVGKGVEYRHA